MRIRDMLHCLQNADPDAVILYLVSFPDVSDADELNHAYVVTDVWLSERNRLVDGLLSSAYHPTEHRHSIGWNPETEEQWPERVVILSTQLPQATDSDSTS
ncbi:hypothetical protein B0G62_10774 [Paraburkholderia eburnea]|uniref:Uncharacterized protein n=1 Tax=Paraburkholderia eburnea TaxID=1189126 RepID=A0A2S4M8H9_9BURK|nr:hypothetical protein [Paraburkholderia eburnea]POR51048.1 hypothetical protein B0G62_10774 [Paraburkholderia eburnea]PRZ21783.1 hypothetical protein BX588_10874 [Paraburkholderia eburnea]